jgi:predicted dehydrogenase
MADAPPSKVPTGVVIGAGDRGTNAYVPLLLEETDLGRIVAVAERDPLRRGAFAERFGLAPDRCFAESHELLGASRIADFALIATPDADHVEPALQALERGYHVLLEKPMATHEADCERLVAASEACGRLLQICHVLRYAPLYRAVKQVIDSGEIGEVITIQHSENVSTWHYAHSYCRGHWRNREQSSPMILAKSCHDLDLLCWLADSTPRQLTSLERPTELCSENTPEGAPEFCIEGCPHSDSCSYDAVAMYRDLTPLLLDLRKKTRPAASEIAASAPGPGPADELPKTAGWSGWPVSVMTSDVTPTGIERALRETRYGRCVYRVGDNDQPSSQNVAVLFENGVNASFTMHSTSHREGRETRIDGTRGTLVAGFYTLENFLEVSDHKSGGSRQVPLDLVAGAHGGSDPKLFRDFLAAVRGEGDPITTARESLWSHRMAFAADRCAREGVVASWSSQKRK